MIQAVLRGYRFKLKIRSKSLEHKLIRFAGCYRLIYNLALEQRIWAWNQRRIFLSYARQCLELPQLKHEFPFLKEIHSQVLQQALLDLDKAFRNFFSGNAEFPKFKKKGYGFSFRYPQGVKVQDSRVYLPKIGWVRFFKSRQIHGRIKQTTVEREPHGWFVSFIVEQEKDIPALRMDNLVGIDMGVRYFLTTSDGHQEGNPLYMRRYARKLTTLQRRLSRKKKFSKNWSKGVRKVARFHSKVAHCRQDYLHKVSTAIAKSHGVVVEDLKVKNMSKSVRGTMEKPGRNVGQKSGLNRVILDSGWGAFFSYLRYKCTERGHQFVAVSPHHTSQTCSRCGYVNPENRRTQAF